MVKAGLHEIMASYLIVSHGETNDGHLGISVAFYIPDKPVIGVVQLIHGMNEHKERYYPFMKYLAENGYASIICDNIGHGKSIASPEDLGFLYFNDSASALINTQNWLRSFISKDKLFEETPDIPVFLVGHSLGSLIARCIIQNNCDGYGYKGVFLLGTPCYTSLSIFADMIESELSKKFGSRYRSENIYEWSEKFLNRKFGNIPHSWICSDPIVVAKYNSDPLCNFMYTLSGYESLIKLMKQAYSEERNSNKPPNFSLPIHLISGKDDPCMFSEEKFLESVNFLEKRGFSRVTFKLYPDMRHEVLNEREKLKVWNDILQKMNDLI